MDLDVKDSDATNDDIIELTDIIEEGNAKAAPKAPGDSIDNLVSDLGNTGGTVPDIPSDAEADIDALLAQMDADTQPAPASTTSTATEDLEDLDEPTAATTETSDEPDTSDVDALLESLDMPPQPAEGVAATENDATASSDDGAEDMDALLESILDTPAPSKNAEPEPAPEPEPELESELASTNSAASDDTLNDSDLDDIDAFLNEVSENAEPDVAAVEDLTMDMPSSDPIEAVEEIATQEAAPKADDSDMLNDLDELLKSVDEEDQNFAAEASSASESATSATDEIDMSDIDQILNDVVPEQGVVEAVDIADALLPEAPQSKGDTLSDTIMDAVSVITDTPDLAESLADPTPSAMDNSAHFEDVHTSGSRLEAMESLLQSQVAGHAELISRVEAVESSAAPSNQEELITRFDELESLLKAQISNTEDLMARLETLEGATKPSDELLPRLEALENSANNNATTLDDSEELKSRIEALENASSTDSSNNTAELSTRLEAIESTLKDQDADQGEVVARYEDMEHMLKTQALNQEEMTTRLDALEKRIVNMEEKLTNDLENMAAKAAAKIIREEIAALLTSD